VKKWSVNSHCGKYTCSKNIGNLYSNNQNLIYSCNYESSNIDFYNYQGQKLGTFASSKGIFGIFASPKVIFLFNLFPGEIQLLIAVPKYLKGVFRRMFIPKQ
jgi:zona occludens toxin (predicted ATPase)